MKLSTWIENKEKELVSNEGFRSASLRDVTECQMSRYMTSTIFSIVVENKISTDIEITEVDRSTLDGEKIDALEVVFDVVKPRCRKPDRLRFYVTRI